ncbi:MAG: hypothetical protein NT133_18335 [Alphaproteobacteria bacterium]|nr:hypothetical protein [Alphaproteobacteria bacterium]
MIRAAWFALLLVAAVLGFTALRPEEDGGGAPATGSSMVANAPAAQRGPIVADPELVAGINARPLFNPSRRPLALGTPAVADISEPPAALPPRLAGIVVSATSKTAIFVRAEDGRSLTLGEGGRIGDDTVLRIEPGAVTLEGPAGRRVLRTMIDTATPPPAASAEPPAPAVATPSIPRMGAARRGPTPPLQPVEE